MFRRDTNLTKEEKQSNANIWFSTQRETFSPGGGVRQCPKHEYVLLQWK